MPDFSGQSRCCQRLVFGLGAESLILCTFIDAGTPAFEPAFSFVQCDFAGSVFVTGPQLTSARSTRASHLENDLV